MRRLALLGVLVACGGTEAPELEVDVAEASTGAEERVVAPAEPEGPALAATGAGATAEEAIAALRTALRERVLGAWGRAAPVTLVGAEAVALETVDGRVHASVSLSEAELRALVEALPERLPRAAFDGPFAEHVAPLQEAAIANFVCERSRTLFEDAECDQSDVEEAARLAAESLRPLRLEPVWAGGVPLGGDGQPLRKPAVRLALGDEAATGLTGLPLVATPVEGTPVRVAVGGDGVALLNIEPGEGLVVTLDRAALVPPLGTLFPELRAPLSPRRTSLRRWALVAEAGPFADALGRALRESGAEEPLTLARGRSRVLKTARGSRRSATLRALANEHGGALDVVLVATVQSHFASRMGSRRTWYEARAEVEAFLTWTGESLGTFDAQANESGIGDQRAEAAARAKVARDIARQLIGAPALGLGRDATVAALEGAIVAAF